MTLLSHIPQLISSDGARPFESSATESFLPRSASIPIYAGISASVQRDTARYAETLARVRSHFPGQIVLGPADVPAFSARRFSATLAVWRSLLNRLEIYVACSQDGGFLSHGVLTELLEARASGRDCRVLLPSGRLCHIDDVALTFPMVDELRRHLARVLVRKGDIRE